VNLPAFSVERRVTVTMLALIVALFGVIFYFQLGLDLMPEIDFPLVAVVTKYEGVAPEDIEQTVTRPIEEIVSTIQGVRSVRSISKEGTSTVQVEFSWGTNLDFAAQDVRDKLGLVEDYLPAEAERPIVLKFDIGDMPVVVYVVSGLEDTLALRKYLEDEVAPQLERLEGVATAVPLGGLTREVQVRVSQDELRKRGLSVDAVIAALRRENLNVSGGHIVTGRSEHLLRTLGEFRSVDDIRNTVVAAWGGAQVLVGDVAEVIDTHKEVRQYVRANGRPAVMFMVLKQSGANTVSVGRAVREALERLKPRLPPSVRFHAVMDMADMVERVVSRTTANALQGAALTIGFMLVFLWSARATLAIAVAIPLSVLATFVGLYAIGYTFNLFTLAGLALGVGMLVDNAVVVIENTFRHLESGEEPALAAAKGANEVGLAITASTLTTMAVFLPMVLVGGLAGKLSRPLALTVCVALLASLFVAITLVPAIARTVFSGGTAEEYRRRFERGWFVRLKERYRRSLEAALAHKAVVLVAAFAMFVGSVAVLGLVGSDFLPNQDIPMSMMRIRMPVGTTLAETDAAVSKVEQAALGMSEALVVGVEVGPAADVYSSAEGSTAADVNEAIMFVRLKQREERERSSMAIEDSLRAAAPRLPGSQFAFEPLGLGSMTTGAEQAPVAVRIFGPDLDTLARLGRRAKELMAGIRGLRDLRLSTEEGKPELRVRLDRARAAEFGISVFQAASTIRTAAQGTLATVLRSGGEETDIRVIFSEADRNSVEKILDLTVASPSGAMVRLSQIAEIEPGRGPLQILRERRERKVSVTANITDRSLGEVVADIREAMKRLELPQGYSIDYGGSYEDMVVTLRALFWAFVAAVFLVYMILAAQLESLVQPFIIMLTVPLGVVGVAFGLGVMGMTLSLPALLGTCILVGIVVNNAIVMIDYMNRLRKEGVPFREAIVQGAVTRLRPILVTSLTTIVGVLPMGFASSQGAEMRAPIGITVGFGLAFGMLLTLYVIPIAYSLLAKRSIARTD